jgi:hypothetical protein
MNLPDGAMALLTLDGCVLLVLLFSSLVARRELMLLDRRVSVAGASTFDGIEIGAPIPRTADPAWDRALLFMHAACEPCYDIARSLSTLTDLTHVEVVLRNPGADSETERLVRRSLPAGMPCIIGEEAERAADSFSVRSSPFGIAVESGLVVSKGYLRSIADVAFLISQARQHNDDAG